MPGAEPRDGDDRRRGLDTCDADLEKAIKAAKLTGKPEELEADKRLDECCRALAESDTADGDQILSHPCCAATQYHGAACTPWGPPMPPCMPESLNATA